MGPVGPKGPRGPQTSSHVAAPMRGNGPITPVSTSDGLSLGPIGPKGPKGPKGPGEVPVSPEDTVESAFPLLSITPIQPSELSIAPIVVGPIVTGQMILPPIVK